MTLQELQERKQKRLAEKPESTGFAGHVFNVHSDLCTSCGAPRHWLESLGMPTCPRRLGR